tara:strand:- start:1314 stop:3464 length:2151 start_codon:yes stop_codon:yes gene_type:complete
MISVPDISQTYPKESLTLDSRFIVGEGNARDLSSDANTGTIVSGRAISFDGTGDYLDGGSIAAHAFTGSFTVSLWAKSSSATEQTFLMKFSGGSTGYQVTLRADQNPAYWQCSVADDAGWQHARVYETQVSANWDDGAWRHIVLRANNGTLEGYVDGVIGSDTDTYNNSIALGTSGQRMTLGGNYASTPTKLATGSMSHVKIFNTALSADQITELYNNPEQVLPTGATSSNLISFWPLSDFDNTSPNSLDGLYFMDLGTAKSNAEAYGTGMDRKEESPCPQLGLMPSSARYLSQVDDLYTITQDSDINALFASGGSMSFWICPFSDGEGNFGRLIDASNTGYLFLIQGESGGNAQLAFIHFFDGDDGNWKTTNLDVPIGSWSHIVITYDASDVANDPVIYVNASSKAITEDTDPTGTVNADNSNKIIGNQAGNGRAFDGYISECAMWKTVLDADAVTAIYNSGVQGFDLLSDSGNYDVSSNLKGWWKINNAFTSQDLTSYNNDATASGSPVLSVLPEGATAGTTVFGNTEEKRADSAVINLDGHSYVTIPSDTDLNPTVTDGFTVSIWAKMTNLGNGSSTAILQKDSGSSRYYLRIRDDAGDSIQFNFGDGTGTTDIGSGTLTDNDWHHYVFILKTSGSTWTTADQYMDGAIQTSGEDISARTQTNPSTGPLVIGGASTTAEWAGAIAYPKIYARELSANEVKLLYSSGLRVVRGL